jgi:hypothetical protein
VGTFKTYVKQGHLMTQWQVQLIGDARDLEYLANVMGTGARKVLREKTSDYLYESNSFAACVASEDVEQLAEGELAVLSGILKIERGARECLNYGAVYRSNSGGGRDIFVRVKEAVHVRAEVGTIQSVVKDSQGNVISQPAPPPPRSVVLLQLAAENKSIAKVLRLLSASDAMTWVSLYRINEVIEEDVGGQHKLEALGWSAVEDLRRFKHSANSVHVGGDKARHGTEHQKPPKNPMTLSEAEAYGRYLVQAWFASKGA